MTYTRPARYRKEVQRCGNRACSLRLWIGDCVNLEVVHVAGVSYQYKHCSGA